MEDARLILGLRRSGIRDERVLAAMTLLSRADFVPDRLRDIAAHDEAAAHRRGADHQPAVRRGADERGARAPAGRRGCSRSAPAPATRRRSSHLLGADVYTIEIPRRSGPGGRRAPPAVRRPAAPLRTGDGYAGWPEAAPFDAIVLTAAPERMPLTLVEQLAPGGRLVGPIGSQNEGQELVRLRKRDGGQLETERLISVRFVPMTPAPLQS